MPESKVREIIAELERRSKRVEQQSMETEGELGALKLGRADAYAEVAEMLAIALRMQEV